MSEFDFTPVEREIETVDGQYWNVVVVNKARKMSKCKFRFRIAEDIGQGTFGTVKEIITPRGDHFAMKQLEYDPRYKNREVAIMRSLDHPNCCRLFYYFVDRDPYERDMTVNLVMEQFPTCLSTLLMQYRHRNEDMNLIHIRLYLYQLLRGVAYLHLEGIAHRDIKPPNLLINEATSQLKICDFGSAKKLVEGEPNIAYICSRFYRAPELILGNTLYNCSVDTWAVGCVFAELFNLRPIFVGESSLDQFAEIIRILGTPNPEQMEKLHPDFPKDIKKRDPICLKKHLRRSCTQSISLLTKLLQYAPDNRIRCWDALAEPYFDELRKPGLLLPGGGKPPPLFNFSARELEQNPVLNQLLLPDEEDKSRRSLNKTEAKTGKKSMN
ncbi:glycogen synthase kinase-3 beta-like [Galendromus occidentalis]|uniref:Glycogen synthase kinase-3 beta-like n=1 Tax=Galendromus occidentalis TaxID=34638 RepID=A0AAJ6QYZ3_9ACAR|nr:glycogen synthase kinase-3 beta-like [Galendromus occidentalis]